MPIKHRPKLVRPATDGPATLYFNTDNAKLRGTRTAAFSLPAGYTCPGACDCLAYFDRKEGKLKDGPKAKFRCFAAALEAGFRTVRDSVDRNLAILKEARTTERMAEVIDLSLPGKVFSSIRIHADGDFFSQAYFLAWCEAARRNPTRLFYAYTKSLMTWVNCRRMVPGNLVLTASRGGKWDSLIDAHGLRSARVVYHPEEAAALGLEIDHDDSHAKDPGAGDFALLLHGMQPAGSEPAAALSRMRREGIEFSYGRRPKAKAKTKTKSKR